MLKKFLPKTKTPDGQRKGSWGLVVLVAALVLAAAVKVIGFFMPGPSVPLFAEAPGLVQTASLEEAGQLSGHPVLLPADMLGAQVRRLGVYTQPAERLPQGSVAIILERGGWRFAELIEKPGVTLDAERGQVSAGGTQEVNLGATNGLLLALDPGRVRCVEPKDEGGIGVCQLTHILLFETSGFLVSIAADGSHATEGELILLAKSMLDK